MLVMSKRINVPNPLQKYRYTRNCCEREWGGVVGGGGGGVGLDIYRFRKVPFFSQKYFATDSTVIKYNTEIYVAFYSH